MSYLVCEADDCKQPFEPAPGQEETQKYCSVKCRNRVRIRRFRARHRVGGPNGGPPGGKRQAALFSRSELVRRKPSKSTVKPKPKQDGLFPLEGSGLVAAIGEVIERLTPEQRQEIIRIVAQDRRQEFGPTSDKAKRGVQLENSEHGGQVLCKIPAVHLRKPSQSVISFEREFGHAA